MPVTAPVLIGISARYEEAVVVRTATTTMLVLFKALVSPGVPQREVELFSLTAAINVGVGPFFFNLRPTRLEVLNQDFFLVSMLARGLEVVRFYWNPVTASIAQDVKYMDVDLGTGLPVSAGSALQGFVGSDPFIMDARSVTHANRLYMVYVTSMNQNAYRISEDFGASFGPEVIFDPGVGEPSIIGCEANVLDRPDPQENVQVLQQRNV